MGSATHDNLRSKRFDTEHKSCVRCCIVQQERGPETDNR